MIRRYRLISLGLLSLLLIQSLYAAEPRETKRVLVLNSEDRYHPPHDITDRGIREVFRANKLFDVQIYTEYMDQARFSAAPHVSAMANYLRSKYSGMNIDVIIAVYPYTVAFLLAERQTLFPGVPIIASQISRSDAEELERSPARRYVTGTVMGENIDSVVDTALRVKPATKHFALVAGTTRNDGIGERAFRKGLSPYADKIDLIDLTKLPVEEILARVGALPPDTIVFYSGVSRDGAGNLFVPREALSLIARAATAPVFGIHESALSYGIVGGRLVSYEKHGRETAEQALRILEGESPASIPFGGDQAYVNAYDWLQLDRWGIDERKLPKGSIMINQPPDFLGMYKWYILGTLLFIILETLLVTRLLLVLRERRLAHQALQESEDRYRMLVETMNEGVSIQDEHDGLIVYVNDQLCEMLGYSREEIIGRPVRELFDEANQSIWREQMDKRREGAYSPYEITATRKDGRKITIHVSPKSILGSEGQFKGSFGVITDVTERNLMQEKVRKAAEEWQKTFDSSADLVMILDPHFKIARVNAATLSFFNLPPESVLGNTCHSLMHGTSEPHGKCPFTAMMKTKTHQETDLYDDNRGMWFAVSVDPILSDRGEITNIVHRVTDITARRLAEAEAQRARTELLRVERSSRLGQLVASLAHELNQPLTAILSSAQAALRFLQSGAPDLHLFRTILQHIVEDDKRAAGVITSLRSLVKREERKTEPLDVNGVLQDVLTLFRSEAVTRNVEIETNLTDSLPPIAGDRVQLQQVMLNLFMNAAEAMSDIPQQRRKMIVRTRATDHGIQVNVRDSGPGIDPVKLEDIWQPFFTTKDTGLGMGLDISRSIIQAHGGRIWAENNPDSGATFIFEIPTIKEQQTDTL